jgi:CelD/BcsL family acetyltransferase involved in cellulose biosynthesis
MQTILVNSFDSLIPFRDQWDELAGGNPFRLWDWNARWWAHFGRPDDQLQLVCVFDNLERLIGVAPWYLTQSATAGKVLRFLGDGEVCSDYLGILAQEDNAESIVNEIAQWLLLCNDRVEDLDNPSDAGQWDLIDLDGTSEKDTTLALWADKMQEMGAKTYRSSNCSFWKLDLPTSLEEYIKNSSKNHRKKLKRCAKILNSPSCQFKIMESADQIDEWFEILVRLHQRRFTQMGEPGCFSSPDFTAFHKDIINLFFRTGNVQLSMIEHDGNPISIQYNFLSDGTIYHYQGGLEPNRLDLEPGNILQLSLVTWAIKNGFHTINWLRGDEVYKGRFGANPSPVVRMRVVPPRLSSQCRNAIWTVGRDTKHWISRQLKSLSKAGPT